MNYPLSFKETPYHLYYLCFFYDFISAVRTAMLVTVVQLPAACAFHFIRFFKLISTKWAVHRLTPSTVSKMFTTKPVRKANGKIKAEIIRAVFNPRSFIVIVNWATQGMKRVKVTAATTSCTPVNHPASCIP